MEWDGPAIRALRARAGLTQEGLARALGVSLSTVQKWEVVNDRHPQGLYARALDEFAATVREPVPA